MTSIEMRANPLFMRNGYETVGKWDIQLVACSDTRVHDSEENKKRGVHFFVDDFRFKGIYKNPERTLDKYSQYAFLLTPDYSLYADMLLWKQVENIAKNRWVGSYWQGKGLTVMRPTHYRFLNVVTIILNCFQEQIPTELYVLQHLKKLKFLTA